MANGTYADDNGVTVAQFLPRWLDEKTKAGKIRAGTVKSYGQHIRDHLVPHLGRHRLRDLGPTHMQTMLVNLLGQQGGPEAPTILRIHATLRSALTTAMKRQSVATNVAKLVDLPGSRRPKVRPWTAQELGRFLDATKGDRLGALFEVAALTGLRRGEVCALRWDDVDPVQGVIVVRQQLIEIDNRVDVDRTCPYCGDIQTGHVFTWPKTASGERAIDVDEDIIGTLLAHQFRQSEEREKWGIEYNDHGLVFAAEDGNPLRVHAVTKRFRELAEAAGVRPVRFHDLRHGFASTMLAGGVQLRTVAGLLGHSQLSITADTYTHL